MSLSDHGLIGVGPGLLSEDRGMSSEDVFQDNTNHGPVPGAHAKSSAGDILLNKRIIKRDVGTPTRKVTPAEIRAVHRAMNIGMDQHRWGSNVINTSTGEWRKASWIYTQATYSRLWLEKGTRQRQYTADRRAEHLTGAACDFFCGKAPSDGETYQFAIIDGDNKCRGFRKLDRLITKTFPELIPEPSTSGKGTHRLIKISYYNGKAGRLQDRPMHDAVIRLHSRLVKATRALAKGSEFEIKGACCAWDDTRDGFLMGTLARMPVALTAAQIEALPTFTLAQLEQRLAALETLAGVASPAVETPSETSQETAAGAFPTLKVKKKVVEGKAEQGKPRRLTCLRTARTLPSGCSTRRTPTSATMVDFRPTNTLWPTITCPLASTVARKPTTPNV